MPKKEDITQELGQQILSRLSHIEHKVDSLDETNAFALSADSTKHFEEVKKIFGRSKRRAQIYLAANGYRGVQEIAAYLGMTRQAITPELRILKEEGLLVLTDSLDGRDIWAKKQIDRTLRISHFLQEEFSLQKDGKLDTVSPKGRSITRKN